MDVKIAMNRARKTIEMAGMKPDELPRLVSAIADEIQYAYDDGYTAAENELDIR